MVQLVTIPAFGDFARIGGLPTKYDSDDFEKLNDSTIDDIRENFYLDAVYDVESRLSYEEWAKKHTKEASFIFSTKAFREQILKKADLTFRY